MVTTAGDWFETRDLSLSRGARLLLDKLAFALAPGEAILLQGPNGSGKSSLLRALLGLTPSTGRLRFAGEDFTPGSGRRCRHALSQGQKQRLVLARFALATQEPSRRPLWLLDEPSAALDRSGATMLDELLEQHLDHGGAAIVATHLPVLADAVDRHLHRLELG